MLEPKEVGKDLCIHTGVVLREAYHQEDEIHSMGTLNIVEYSFGKCIEWKPREVSFVSEHQDQDAEWSFVESHTRRTRNSSSSGEESDSLGIRPRTIRIPFTDLKSFRMNHIGHQLILMQKDGTTYVTFFQLSNAESFVNSLQGFVKIVKSKSDKNVYLILDESDSALNKSFAELDLFQENASNYVWKLMKNFHDRPRETTWETFSKLSDILLYKEPVKRPVEETVADLLSRSLTVDLQPADEYEIIMNELDKKCILPPRPPCPRGVPLSQEQWDKCRDCEGRIIDATTIKEIIFHGGISPSLRYEVWKFLLNYFPWDSTFNQRTEIKKHKTDYYYRMKLQWKTISTDQEERFSHFRDRKSLVEKDVNRTDRTHPYYSGDNNYHLSQLYDILMTYVMYNFDLGYVQGMSDLLSPILCLMDNEVDAFWCFVGFMEKVSSNFEMDQAGMKAQLCQLHALLSITEPQLAQYLSKHDSGNMFFCFRWLLVLFKREFSAIDIIKLWEIIWTDFPCKNFHLLLCAAILDTEKSALMENRYGFTEILKHINDLSLHIDLPRTLSKAEGIYHQLISIGDHLPDNIRLIIGLQSINKSSSLNDLNQVAAATSDQIVSLTQAYSTSRSKDNANMSLGNNEVSFERGLNVSYL